MRKPLYFLCALALACSLIVTSKAEATEVGEVVSVDGTTITVEVGKMTAQEPADTSDSPDETMSVYEASSGGKNVSDDTSATTEVIVLNESSQQVEQQTLPLEQEHAPEMPLVEEHETISIDLSDTAIIVVSDQGPSEGASSDVKEGSRVIVRSSGDESTGHHGEHLPHEEQSNRRSRRESSQ